MSGARQYRGSPLVESKLCDPFEKWPLPDRYIAVHPFSVNAPTLERDFTASEWMAVQRYAVRESMPIVIVNKGGEKMRDQFGICNDVSDLCDVLESIEIVKRAAAFVGCSSFLASIAAKTLDAQALFVKANWSVKRFYYWLYYAPQETNSFITDDLRKVIPDA
jgi:hypothetical protein